jgi:UDP-N-acetylglucosamine diphosphorylase/glucosamine-1-phosphate N-acetyltransferase
MSFILFDSAARKTLLPLTYTRAIADIRIGIGTIKQWWEKLLNEEVYVQTEGYLQSLYKTVPVGEQIYIDASVLPITELVEKILALNPGEAIADEIGKVAYKGDGKGSSQNISGLRRLEYPWQIFQWNEDVIRAQFKLLTEKQRTVQTSESTHVINANQVFICEDAIVEHAILNATDGPIYIGKNVTIMEGTLIRGPFAIGENSVIKMGTRIYGATSIGANCTIGGEIRSSVIFSNSNKAHDGYLGHSVIAEWCNLGAGTSNSNLKNTAGEICMKEFGSGGTQVVGNKCGVIMGDYCRTAINSSINTGSIFGISCNIFGEGLLPKILSNFSWGLNDEYDFDKAVRDIDNWMKLKGHLLSPEQTKALKYIFEASK